MIRFVLVGPNAGKSKKFSKDSAGKFRYIFTNGVMEVHPSRVNGRFIQRMKQEYSAYIESEVPHGVSEVHEDGDKSERSEAVSSDLTQESVDAAAGSAIHLRDDDGGESRSEERPAKRRSRSGTKASG